MRGMKDSTMLTNHEKKFIQYVNIRRCMCHQIFYPSWHSEEHCLELDVSIFLNIVEFVRYTICFAKEMVPVSTTLLERVFVTYLVSIHMRR